MNTEKLNLEELKIYSKEPYEQEERKKLTAQTITLLRQTNEMQQKEVAELIGVKPQTYGAYENGRNETPTEVLVRLSILYNVPVDLLIQKDARKTRQNALEQIDLYNKQMEEIKEQLLKGDPETSEQFQQFLNQLGELTGTIKEAVEKQLPDNK